MTQHPIQANLNLATAQAVADLTSIDDVRTRFDVAADCIETLQACQAELAKVRRNIVRELRSQGLTLREIGDALDLTHQRVSQIEVGYGRAERKARAKLR